MLFNSWTFIVFFAIVWSLYRVVGHRAQNILLVIASYIFYGFWDWRFTSLLAFSTIVDFCVAEKIYQSKTRNDSRSARNWLLLSISGNLTFLGFFKYYNFFADSFVQLVNAFGMQANSATLNIILPVGISFYTFHNISYIMDVYRGDLKPRKSLLDFALFVTFFPQLVAGPIGRATNLLPQMELPRTVTRKGMKSGAFLIAQGYIKKVLISDNINGIVESTFNGYATASSLELWTGLILFSIQIYFDFSGYTDIARGVARFFGVELMENFRQPYLSRSITEFWSRWHISLSTWLRDYLYIPLGGNRHGTFNTYRNLMLTMLLGGLWHGANWNFILWGGLHGVYLCVDKWMRGAVRPQKMVHHSHLSKWLKCIFVYFIVMLTWLPFRSPDITTTWEYLSGMFLWRGDIFGSSIIWITLVVFVLLIFDLPAYYSVNWNDYFKTVKKYSFFLRLTVYGIAVLLLTIVFYLIILTLLIHPSKPAPFIYFQF